MEQICVCGYVTHCFCCNLSAYWTIRRQTNSRSVNSQTIQLADSAFFTKSWNYYICTQNLTLTINPILTIESVKIV